jgi:Tol biopolymer transport system component
MHIKLIETGETQDIPQPESLKGGRVHWQVVAWFPSGTMFLANASPWAPEVPLKKLEHPSIWTISVIGGTPHKLCEDAYAWSVSPDGTSIAFTTNFGEFGPGSHRSIRVDREVWLMNSDGTQWRKVFETDAASNLLSIRWSPDGQRLAYLRLAQSAKTKEWEVFLESRDLKGSARAIVVAQVGLGLLDFCWLPDGRMIYSLADIDPDRGNFCNFWEVPVDVQSGKPSDKPRRLTNWAGSSMDNMSTTSDGRHLAFRRSSSEQDTYLADLAPNQTRITNVRRLTSHEGELATAWTIDSGAIIFESWTKGRNGIFKQAVDRNSSQPIVTGPWPQQFHEPRVSPDGAWVLYAANARADGFGPNSSTKQIMRVPIAGGIRQPVLTASIVDSQRCAKSPGTSCMITELSPDRKQLIFTAVDPLKGRGRELARFRVDDPTGDYGADISPDGSRIAIVKMWKGRIHILSLIGEKPQEFTVANYINGLDWAADGKGLFVCTSTLRGSALTHVNLQGEAEVVWEQEGTTEGYGVPSPDGRRIALTGQTMNSNMWMLENF